MRVQLTMHLATGLDERFGLFTSVEIGSRK
jgi:hypothetical protein